MDIDITLDWPLDPRSPMATTGLDQVLADLTQAAIRLESLWAVVGDRALPAMHLENVCTAVQWALVELRQCADPEGVDGGPTSN